MESFLTTLPPFVHDYLNKYPPTECFNILKDLICFAVLYSNNREHINLLSLELLEKGADQSVIHKPYVSSTLTLSSLASISSVASPIHSAHDLSSSSPTTNNSKLIPSPPSSVIKQQQEQQQKLFTDHHHHHHHEYSTPLEEQPTYRSIHPTTPVPIPIQEHTHTTATSTTTRTTTLEPTTKSANISNRKTSMPSTFPEWWAHPDVDDKRGLIDTSEKPPADTNNNNTNENTNSVIRSTSPEPISRQSQPTTKTQEMNITNWIPLNYDDNVKPNRNQSRPRPVSVHNPTIPDLRSYLTPTSKPPTTSTTKKSQVQQIKDETKASRRMSAPIPPLSTSPVSTAAPILTSTTRPSKAPTTRKASAPLLNNTGSTILSKTSPSNGATQGSRSGTTTTTSSAYQPKQTATVRRRAEQAKQRQLQLEEEKRKQAAAAAKLASRNSQRLKQQAPSTVNWEAIKKDRRKTMPAATTGYTS